MTLSNGFLVGPYEIIAPIGAGGMGEVYRARDRTLQRDVAIKVLPDSFAADRERLARFEREAQVLASLNHSNIAQIHGLESSNGVRALVLEFVNGEDLAQLLARGPLSVEEALRVAQQIALALEAAHERGIIHRDLKPANIKVREDGTVKVLDFGLAKALDPSSPMPHALDLSPTVTSPAAMTHLGLILGTAAYMSPEQARGKAVDKRADIWAFGAVLYEMLTGKRAFEGDNVSDTVAAILRGDPDWTRLPADTPFLVERLLRHCLAKDPRDRLADIHDARIEIAESLTTPTATALASSRSRTHPGIWAGVGAGIVAIPLLVALAIGLIRVREAPVHDPVVRFTIPLGDGVGIQTAPTVSPDGRHIVFGAMVSGVRSLWVRSLDTMEMRKLPGTEGAGLPFWAPDSRRIGFFADGKLKTVSLAGGPVFEVCAAANGRGGTWSQDDVIVFSPGIVGGLARVAAGGGNPVPATTLEGSKATNHRWPTFLSDGRHFVFLATMAGGNVTTGARLSVGSLDSTSTKDLTGADSRALLAAPDLLLFLRGGTLMRQRFDVDRLDLIGDSVPVVENVAAGAAGIVGEVLGSVSNTGVLVYRSGSGGVKVRLAWVDRRGAATVLPLQPDQYADPSLSPDGQQIAMGLRDQSGDHIWVYDVARGTFGKRTFEGSNAFAIWSPDSQHITFTRGPGFGGPLLRIRADGSGKLETVVPEPQTAFGNIATAWSGDGRLAFARGPDVMVREPDGTIRAVLASPAMEREGRFSPDGKWLSYRSNETGRDEIYVQGYPTGGKWQISTAGGAQAIWAASGRELFYKSGNRLMVVPVELTPTFKPGTPRVLFEMPLPERTAGDPSRFGVTPDGKRFLILTTAPGQESGISSPLTIVLNWNQSHGSAPR